MIEVVSSSVFYEIAALLVLAAGIGLAGLYLRLPLIVSFLVVGILAGPTALDLARSGEHIELLAELGVTTLLFLVGLKLDLNLIRTIGAVALVAGLVQVTLTAALGFALCLALGLAPLPALYIAGALAFSSTIIIVKLLSDKREIDSLHGRIALGILIVQDLVVVFAMVLLSAASGEAGRLANASVAVPLAGEVALLAGIWLFIRYAASPLLGRLARSPELMVAFAIGWAALLASLEDLFGFSKELGGLIAGVSLATTPYREAIGSRLASLRDFMLLFFFVGLGARLHLAGLGPQIVPALALSAFVLIGKPVIVMVIMGLMGYRRRTGFLSAVTLAQISEFSLIFAALGLALGHIDEGTVGLVTLIGLVTIGLSTYMIMLSNPLYRWIEPGLGPFERRVPHREETGTTVAPERGFEVILFGLGRYGGDILRGLRQRGVNVLGVDFDPEVVRRWQHQGFAVRYGDAGDPDFPKTLPLAEARWVVSAVPQQTAGVTHQEARLALLEAVRAHGFAGRTALTVHDAAEAIRLRRLGVDIVLMPFVDAARQAVDEIVGFDEVPPAAAGLAAVDEAAGRR